MTREFLGIVEERRSTLGLALTEPHLQPQGVKLMGILSRVGITTWGELESKTCTELAKVRGVGKPMRALLRNILTSSWKRLQCGCPEVCKEPPHLKGQGLKE